MLENKYTYTCNNIKLNNKLFGGFMVQIRSEQSWAKMNPFWALISSQRGACYFFFHISVFLFFSLFPLSPYVEAVSYLYVCSLLWPRQLQRLQNINCCKVFLFEPPSFAASRFFSAFMILHANLKFVCLCWAFFCSQRLFFGFELSSVVSSS